MHEIMQIDENNRDLTYIKLVEEIVY